MFTAAEWDKDVAGHAPPNLMLVATDEGGRVVGFTAVHPKDCEMYLLFVDPAASGRGVGRTLLAAADSALRAAGCREAFLYTHEQNERALHVYASAGYLPDGSIRETEVRGTRLRELPLVKRLE